MNSCTEEISYEYSVQYRKCEPGLNFENTVLNQINIKGENSIPLVNSSQSIQRKCGTSSREATPTDLARKQGLKGK